MTFSVIIYLITTVSQIFVWIVIASAILSFFLQPGHPVREALDRIVDPFLNPIRRMMPATGALDFSPLVLILLIQFIAFILVKLLQ